MGIREMIEMGCCYFVSFGGYFVGYFLRGSICNSEGSMWFWGDIKVLLCRIVGVGCYVLVCYGGRWCFFFFYFWLSCVLLDFCMFLK